MKTFAIVFWSSHSFVSTLCDVRKLRVIGSCMWQDRINYIAAMFGQLLFYADARYDHIILSFLIDSINSFPARSSPLLLNAWWSFILTP